MKAKIVVMGDEKSILCFKAAGFETVGATLTTAPQTLRRLVKTHDIIFVTEDLLGVTLDIIRKTDPVTYPVVLPIPSAQGATGEGMREIKLAGERALGVDILFNREDK